jgi:hypothetical protein
MQIDMKMYETENYFINYFHLIQGAVLLYYVTRSQDLNEPTDHMDHIMPIEDKRLGDTMKRYKYNPTYLRIKAGAQQLLLPFLIFQLIRTLLLPTSFDVLLLIVLILLYVGLYLDWF